MMDIATPAVLDSNIVSYLHNRHSIADLYLDHLRGKHLVVSFQTIEEIWFGASKDGWGPRRRNEMARHLEQYEVIWANSNLVSICAELRSERELAGRRLNVADAWIAATALLLDCPLVSHDGDFDDISNLQLIRAPSEAS